MAKAGAPNELYIWDFTIARIPLLVVSILYMTFVGYKLMPDIDNNTFVDGGHTGRKSAKLSPIKEKIAIIIIVVTILAMLFESVIGIPMYIVACIGAVLLVLSGILNEKEALDSIHQRCIRDSTCADEMLYPENHRYLSDLLSYVAVGARSVEDQQHLSLIHI